MKTNEPAESIEQFGKALTRLEEVLQRMPSDDIVIDATIQRFEFTIELCWKALKKKLAYEGIETTTPRSVLQQSYISNWINDEQLWLNMLADRNLTSHTYREEQARAIYARISSYARAMRELLDFLKLDEPGN